MAARRKCVFCEARGTTREDVFEREINKILGITGPVTMTMGRQTTLVRPPNPTLDVVVRTTCQKCNNVWLNRIWGRFRDVMRPAILNKHPVTLSIQDQMDVSMWAVKTALLLEMATRSIRRDSWLPMNHFTHLRREGHPPPGTGVWLFRVDAENNVAAWHQAGVLREAKERPLAYIATFTIGYLGMQVLGRRIVETPTGSVIFRDDSIKPPPDFSRILRQVLPVAGPIVRWPPQLALRVEQLPLLANWPYSSIVVPTS